MIANELRIGNLVYDFGGNIVPVIRITKDKQPLETPIPLTPEILQRCGFVQSENLGGFIDFKKTGLILKIDWTKQQIKTLNDFSVRFELNNKDYIEIKHIHQLQNLYFALTGEELKINLHVETAN